MDEHLKINRNRETENHQDVNDVEIVPANDSNGEISRDIPATAATDPVQVSRKVAANRRNAQKSTGPKTAAGKRRVARNAIKHGLFTSKLLVNHPDAQEDPAELNALYQELLDYYKPCGILEELLTEQITVLNWRLRRVIRCETAKINKAYIGPKFNNFPIDEERPQEQIIDVDRPINGSRDYLLMPDRLDLDMILRSEAMLRKELSKTMSQLKELQSSRMTDSAAARSRAGFVE